MTAAKALRDAIVRLKAAMLDLIQAGRHDEAEDVAILIKRLERGS